MFERLTRNMTREQAAAWFRDQANHDYESRAVRDDAEPYMSNRSVCRISIKAINECVGRKKRKPEMYKGDTVLPQWYHQGHATRRFNGY